VQSSASGFSVLGADPSQNRTLIDGADFGGGNLPRDAIQTASLATNAFDPAQGRFAGGEFVVQTRRGSTNFASTVRAQLLPNALSWRDPKASTPVSNRFAISGFAAGPIRKRTVTGLAAFDLSGTRTDVASLLNPRAAELSAFGVSPDTVNAVVTALGNLGVPYLQDQRHRSAAKGSAFLRGDFEKSSTTRLAISALANWEHVPHAGDNLGFPSATSTTDGVVGRLLVNGSTYISGSLDELSLSVESSASCNTPTVTMPAGIVRIANLSVDNRVGTAALQFGGTGSSSSRRWNNVLRFNNSLSVLVDSARHQLKFTQELVIAQSELSGSPGGGTFSYLNIDALRNNQPSSYENTFLAQSGRARETTFGASVGDNWSALPGKLELQGGVRVDATVFPDRPVYNRNADSIFHLRTDQVPNPLAISPRVSFKWRPFGRSPKPIMPEGTSIEGASFTRGRLRPMDAAGVGVETDERFISVSGGIGVFNGTFPLYRVLSLRSTASPVGQTRVSCVGDATPRPLWAGAQDFPSISCLDGVGFATYTPNVTAIGSDFHPPTNWRGSMGIQGLYAAGMAIVPQFSYSVGTNSESRIDLNFVELSRFVLNSEANRRVYAPVSAIDVRTGLVAAGAGRQSAEQGSVFELTSDLRYRALQTVVSLVPRAAILGGARAYLTYSYNRQRVLSRGFAASTNEDPRQLEWTSGSQPAHQILLGLTNLGRGSLRIASRISLNSGSAFTPLVGQDINGDGVANDRAFIPNPAVSQDTVVAHAVATLLTSAPSNIRRCLQRQLGAIAKQNSCRLGWGVNLDLAINVLPPDGFGLGDRIRATVNVFNAGNALVRAFKLENTALGRGAQSSTVDTRLLDVVAFDSVKKQFRYTVNQQFGERRSLAGAQALSPFSVQVGVQVLFGQVASAFPNRPRIVEDPETERNRIVSDLLRQFAGPDPIQKIGTLVDSLGLDELQRAGVVTSERSYLKERDSILSAIVRAVQTKAIVRNEQLNSRMNAALQLVRPIQQRYRAQILSLLSAEQRTRLDQLTKR
ncbi:MAG: hypothetical protein ABJB74_20925, partial [Gemmatimonas sp.]